MKFRNSPPPKKNVSTLPPENFSTPLPRKFLNSPPPKISHPPPKKKFSTPPPENLSTHPKISQPPTKISQHLPKISQPPENLSTPSENISTPKNINSKNMLRGNPLPSTSLFSFSFYLFSLTFQKKF